VQKECNSLRTATSSPPLAMPETVPRCLGQSFSQTADRPLDRISGLGEDADAGNGKQEPREAFLRISRVSGSPLFVISRVPERFLPTDHWRTVIQYHIQYLSSIYLTVCLAYTYKLARQLCPTVDYDSSHNFHIEHNSTKDLDLARRCSISW